MTSTPIQKQTILEYLRKQREGVWTNTALTFPERDTRAKEIQSYEDRVSQISGKDLNDLRVSIEGRITRNWRSAVGWWAGGLLGVTASIAGLVTNGSPAWVFSLVGSAAVGGFVGAFAWDQKEENECFRETLSGLGAAVTHELPASPSCRESSLEPLPFRVAAASPAEIVTMG